MAKRYHSSKRARQDEHMGMERYERGPVVVGNGHSPMESGRNRSEHRPDQFNDEMRRDKGDERAPYNHFRASGDHMEFYAGSEARKRQEMQDSGMIRENPNAIANLPQEVMMKPYPYAGANMPEGLEDSIEGVDHQMGYDNAQRRAHFYPKKV